MTPEQREELKRAAQAATPGPWRKGPSGGIYTEGPDSFGILSALTPSGSLRNASANEEYAALADPAAILSLIAQVEALTVPQWIETANAMPELDVPVLAIRNGCWGIGERYTRGDGGVAYRFNNTTAIGDRMKFECWMPLPAAPTIPAIPGTKEGA